MPTEELLGVQLKDHGQQDTGLRLFAVGASEIVKRGGMVKRMFRRFSESRTGYSDSERKVEIRVAAVWEDKDITEPEARMRVMPCTVDFKIRGEAETLHDLANAINGGAIPEAGPVERADGEKIPTCDDSNALLPLQVKRIKDHGFGF